MVDFVKLSAALDRKKGNDMNTATKPNALVRATTTCRVVNGRKDPTKRYGFQTMGLLKGEGMFQEFDQMYDPEKASHFLPPGDYEVVPSGAYLDRDGRLQIGKEFVRLVPVKS
jgi:hypothetical protein